MLLYKNEISSTFEAVHETVVEIMDQLKLIDQINKTHLLFRINFMLREVLNNAVEHGNEFHEDKKIFIEVCVKESYLITKVRDEGKGISLNPTHEHNMDYILRERTRGMSLVQQYQFELEVNDTELCVKLDLDSVEEEV